MKSKVFPLALMAASALAAPAAAETLLLLRPFPAPLPSLSPLVNVVPNVADVDPDVGRVVAGNNRFAFDLYGQLADGQDGSLFLSPYSISTALAMTYAGARGRTATQMADVLHFDLPQSQLHPAMGRLGQGLSGDSRQGCELNVANRLWGQQGFPLRDAFLDVTAEHYQAPLAEVDFVRQAEQGRQTINRWVEDQTQQKIKDLIPEGKVDASTVLMLTNAIYFNGQWQNPFDEDDTRDLPFTVSPAEQIDVPTMHQTGRFRYAAADDYQVLELPYQGGDVSMLALLPHQDDGIDDLDTWLSTGGLDECLDGLQLREVSVFLPKFQMTTDFSLVDQLVAMGMPDAFNAHLADFGNMIDSLPPGQRGDLYIDDVIHKAFVDVNEQGTEAAAATAVIIERCANSLSPSPVVFRADHPFAFLIRDNVTGSILFMGRVADPSGGRGSPNVVPEPSTLALLAALAGAGLLAVTIRRWSRRVR